MKARNQQIVPLSKALVRIMEDYLEHRSGDLTAPLFVSEYGNQMTLNSLGNAIWNYNHSRGVDKTSMHLFRHTYANCISKLAATRSACKSFWDTLTLP